MKRLTALLLACALTIGLVGCGSGEKNSKSTAARFKPGTYEGTSKGFNGEIKATVTLSEDKIEKIEVKADGETPTIGGAALEKLQKDMVDAQSPNLEAITGATLSTKGLIEAVSAAIKASGTEPSSLKPIAIEKKAESVTKDTEIAIIGGGGAGMVSAIHLASAGHKVILIEKAPAVGGNSSRATGGMNAAETHYQKEQNIEDTIQTFIDDTMKGGHDKNNPELVKLLASRSAKAIDWLDSIDAKLPSIKFAGGATHQRSHRPVDDNGKVIPVGTFLVEKFAKKVKSLGIEVLYNTRATELLKKDNAVVGVKATGENAEYTINAKAVIVTTGGFGGNADLVVKHRPDLKGYVSTNAPTITGDAIDFLTKAGANFIDMDQIQIHPTVIQKDGYLISESLRGDGAILINAKGKRFINELLTRDVVSAGINKEEGSFAYLLVDQKMFDDSKVVEGYVKKGYMTKAENVDELSKVMSVDAATLKATIGTWSEAVRTKKDAEFNREGLADTKYDLAEGPYYVAKISPGIHHTMGGVEIDTKAQVIGTDKSVIGGLFAAGEVTGGVHGGNRLGGNAVTDFVVFGTIAAESASEYIKGLK